MNPAPTGLLAELRDAKLKLNCLMEQARGPGKHHVFMAVAAACKCVTEAIHAEETRHTITMPKP